MEINKTNFLNYIFAVSKEKNISSISLEDITEIIKVLYVSKEFTTLREKLKIEDIVANDVLTNEYVLGIDNMGIIQFNVNDQEKDNLLEKNNLDSDQFRNAIDKMRIAKYVNQISKGTASFAYDDPDGIYTLPYINGNP